MKHFHYIDTDTVIRITSTRRPAIVTRPPSGIWLAQEYDKKQWIGEFEITLEDISKMVYLGCTVVKG